MEKGATIVITGSTGQLGSELKDLQSSFPQFNFIFFSRDELSITDEISLRNTFERLHPDYLINCAAYTAVDKAEEEKGDALAINATAVGVLAMICKEFNAHFIHISTDYVFNGKHDQPWKETEVVDPINFYGESKLKGEELAIKNNPQSIIIRTSWVYSQYGKNFVKTMIRLMNETESINVVNDQIGSPTYAADLAEAMMNIVSSGKWMPGIYHFSNEGIISWYEFAFEIKKIIGSSCIVTPVATSQYPTPAKRPVYSVLDATKIKNTYNIKLKDWKESLQKCIKKIRQTL